MQEFSLAFGRVTRSVIAANPEMKSHVNELLARAYFNIHASPLTSADPQWVSAISGAALQLCLDLRTQDLSPRELVHLLENVIRISEEHLHEARRHAAMSSNVFYLKETSLDAILNDDVTDEFHMADTKVGQRKAHTGRVDAPKPNESLF